MTVNEILQLSAAGFTKTEIMAMSNVSTGEPKDKPKEPEKKIEQNNDFSAQLAEMQKQIAALVEAQGQKTEPEKKQPEQKDNDDVLALLQSLNMTAQRYDLPPKYDPEKALAAAYCEVMGGTPQEGDNK